MPCMTFIRPEECGIIFFGLRIERHYDTASLWVGFAGTGENSNLH